MGARRAAGCVCGRSPALGQLKKEARRKSESCLLFSYDLASLALDLGPRGLYGRPLTPHLLSPLPTFFFSSLELLLSLKLSLQSNFPMAILPSSTPVEMNHVRPEIRAGQSEWVGIRMARGEALYCVSSS